MKQKSLGGIASQMPKPDPDDLARQSLKKIKQKFVVMIVKGGVGKTSVSVNPALALANKGYQVGLLDVDIHGPDVPRMLGLTGMLEADVNRQMTPMPYSANLKVLSMESLMPDRDTAIIWRGPVKHTAIQQFIGEASWGDLDYMIFDSPPGTGGRTPDNRPVNSGCQGRYSHHALGRIPFDPDMVKCGDIGIAFQNKFKDSAITQAFQKMT